MVNRMYYLNLFFTFSIAGYFFENIVFKLLNSNKKSGFLHLWWTPIYGYGVLLSIFLYKFVHKKKYNLKKEVILLIFLNFFVLSILEFCGGYFLKLLVGKNWWNYSKYPFNIGPYVSLFTSLLWTFFSIVYIYFIKKYVNVFVNKMPKKLTLFLSICFIVDSIVSIYLHIK